MQTFFQAIAAPIMGAPLAIDMAGLIPWFRSIAVGIALVSIACALKRKERVKMRFAANLVPLLVAWPVIGLSSTIWWEQAHYVEYVAAAAWPYILVVICAFWVSRQSLFLSIAAQSLLSIFSIGWYFCCLMGVTGKWI